jgi:hypothetical protein
MEKYRLEMYEKNKELLKKALPTYTEEQLLEYFEIRVDFWEVVIISIDMVNF